MPNTPVFFGSPLKKASCEGCLASLGECCPLVFWFNSALHIEYKRGKGGFKGIHFD